MVSDGIVLTGGASRRMGSDKACLRVNGIMAAERTARELARHCCSVTILGRSPLEGFSFLEDQEDHAGPLAALARFSPSGEDVFIASCDMPRFDGRVIPLMKSHMAGFQAVVPMIDGRLQPLCGLFAASAWTQLTVAAAGNRRSMMAWMDLLAIRVVDPGEWLEAGIDPQSARGANTLQEWAALAEGAAAPQNP